MTNQRGITCLTSLFLILLITACGRGGSSGPVTPAPVTIKVSPAFSSVMLGNDLQFEATGNYNDGSTKDLTLSVEWSSSNERMATIGNSGVATPLATGGVTISAALGGVTGSTLLAITGNASARLVWFTPDVGGTDMLRLFSQPEEWPNARASVQVFKFYTGQLYPPPYSCGGCGQNTEPNLASAGAFSKLNQWGLDIGIEAAAVVQWGCTADVTSSAAKQAIQAVQSNGGVVSYLAMDEPFIHGQSCNYTMQQSATQTAQFVKLMHASNPTLQIGDIEPYPYFLEPQLESWITTLQADGVNLPFFHLDVDRAAVAAFGTNVTSDLQLLSSFCESRGIPFGVIFINETTFSTQELSDQDYYDSTMLWIQTVKSAIGMPQHSIFQSWTTNGDGLLDIPINLPENDPTIYSHTRLINEGLAALSH